MCKCLQEIEQKTLEMLREDRDGQISGGKITNSHFPIIKNQFKDRETYSEFEYKLTPVKKDGTIGKTKTQTINIGHSYCPFCGEKYVRPE